jgi:hypothetical protein
MPRKKIEPKRFRATITYVVSHGYDNVPDEQSELKIWIEDMMQSWQQGGDVNVESVKVKEMKRG